MVYGLLKSILFQFDPEAVHDFVLGLGRVCRLPLAAEVLGAQFAFEDPALEVEAFGLKFKNPFGLAAGFDKNCEAFEMLAALGFGHIEIGTVTAKPQSGNDRPRIFRYPGQHALINRMGFPSIGADRVALNLARLKRNPGGPILGINIGKSKLVPIEDAVSDYVYSFRKLRDFGDYFVLNVSSPNTPDLRKLQEKARLTELLSVLQSENSGKKPLLVKLAPDLSGAELDEVLDCCLECGISGLIATNTTISRENFPVGEPQAGGLSGEPLTGKSRQIVSYLSERSGANLPVIGAGGIMNIEDAIGMFSSGAKMLQIYTGLVYSGPDFVRRLKVEFVNFVRKSSIFQDVNLLAKNK